MVRFEPQTDLGFYCPLSNQLVVEHTGRRNRRKFSELHL